ncbi:hypothetical protein [Thermocatellispora tengchongensis]
MPTEPAQGAGGSAEPSRTGASGAATAVAERGQGRQVRQAAGKVAERAAGKVAEQGRRRPALLWTAAGAIGLMILRRLMRRRS